MIRIDVPLAKGETAGFFQDPDAHLWEIPE